MSATPMDPNEFIVLLLFWTLVLNALSYRMLYAKPENQPQYAELIGNLILTAILTLAITALSG